MFIVEFGCDNVITSASPLINITLVSPISVKINVDNDVIMKKTETIHHVFEIPDEIIFQVMVKYKGKKIIYLCARLRLSVDRVGFFFQDVAFIISRQDNILLWLRWWTKEK